MSSIPANLSRVPTFLASQISLRGLTTTNASLARLQQQLTTGLRINQPSDDPIAGSLISLLDTSLETATQRSRNLNHATSVLNTIDTELGSISALILDAKEIASSQVGIGSDAATRAEQATIVSSLIDELVLAVNSDFAGISLFSGGRTGVRPIEFFHGGYRYNGDQGGLRTDLGPGLDFPITLTADRAIGSLSSRVEGSVDLDRQLTAGTLISDLRGPANIAGDGLDSLTVTVDVAGTPTDVLVDLSNARTVGDVTTKIEAEIRNAVPGALTGAFPGGVTFTGDRFQINAAATVTITFDSTTATPGRTARALGLDSFSFDNADATNPAPGVSLNPRISPSTRLGDLNPATALDYGDIVFTNGSQSGTVTTDPNMTISELQQALERLDLGLNVEISENGDGIDVVSEISGVRASVEEGGGLAATTLGIRSFNTTTSLTDFNDGRGVAIADGAIDPISGLPDASRNVDFEITASDGTTFQVDLTPADATSVQSVLDAINAEAAAAGLTVGNGAGEFQAALTTGQNGILIEDRLGGAGAVQVTSLNGFAAEDLGLLSGTSTTGNPAQLIGEDRATVRVDSLITTLLDLRRALETDDQRGITFAGEKLEAEVDRVVAARALAGGRARRIESSRTRLEDRVLLDEQVKSNLQDLDFIEASTRFSQLQTQLQASLTATAQVSQLSLLNFL